MIKWNIDPYRKLESLRPSKSRAVQRTAVRKACVQAKSDLKAAVPERTGALRRSLAVKVGTTKADLIVYGVVGASRKAVGKQALYTSSKTGSPVFSRPAKYISLIDAGTRFITPRHFLEKTWSGGKNRYLATMIQECSVGYQKAIGA